MAPKKVSKKMAFTEITRDEITYKTITATCACGANFETGSTQATLRVDICSQCHPFFTGDNKHLDTEGRVEKFMKKYAKTQKKK